MIRNLKNYQFIFRSQLNSDNNTQKVLKIGNYLKIPLNNLYPQTIISQILSNQIVYRIFFIYGTFLYYFQLYNTLNHF